ncbi:MAG: hypothetical protein ABSD48_13590 [Armatimonadota bacterium]
MEKAEQTFQNANPIRLAPREWALTALLCLGGICLLPLALPLAGTRLPRPDYRVPGELGSDYWMFRQWSQYAHDKYTVMVLGDSVVWGQYVQSRDTLTHHLNEFAGGSTFANLGVDGLHPAAMAGMVSYYGKGVHDTSVLVHLNPLWMSSAKQDLQTRGEERFNHPKLVPQVVGRPVSYAPTPAEVIEAVLEQQVPFFSWKEHLKIAYWEGMAFPDWSLENPYVVTPKGRGPDSFSGDEPGSEPMTWQKRGIAPANLPWLEMERSYQWRSFKRVVSELRSRKNRVFVIIGPFNTYALTPESRARYAGLKRTMEQWLDRERIPYSAPRLLPTDLYADVSHPLGDGYRSMAKELWESPTFQSWLRDGMRQKERE